MYSEWSERWGRDGTALLLDRHPDIDAIICGSDQIARGALDTVRDRGHRVPDDVAVIGFDNWEPMVEHSRPQLTSVDPNLQLLGRAAAQQVFAALDGHTLETGTRNQAPRLVIRGSTVPRS
jgi:LacI family transcriptional regulator